MDLLSRVEKETVGIMQSLKAPFMVLEVTHQKAWEYTTLKVLQKYKAEI